MKLTSKVKVRLLDALPAMLQIFKLIPKAKTKQPPPPTKGLRS